jgi:hypothetical protein
VSTGATETTIETETVEAIAPGRVIVADQDEIVPGHQKGGIQTVMTGDIRDLGTEMVHSDITTGTAGGMTTTTEIAEVGSQHVLDASRISLVLTYRSLTDHARSPRRSQSPSASHNDLPTRTHPKHRQPDDNRRSPDRKPRDDQPVLSDEGEYHSRKRDQDDSKSRGNGDEMVEDGEEEEVDDDMAAMQAMMGFGSFNSTKGKKVAGNNAGGVRKEKKSEYRQYMNRQGGFNRPLSPSR